MDSPKLVKPGKVPGVYITEFDAFPPSIVGVQTAVPAFIGYTQKATIAGKPVLNQAIRIDSLAEFERIFGKGYKSVYAITPVTDEDKTKNGDFDFKVLDSTAEAPELKYFDLVPTSNANFNLYNSMRLFYANGGANCFVVSVGLYEEDAADGTNTATPTAISGQDLEGGLDVIKEQVGPTMLVIPDAVLLQPTSASDPMVSAEFKKVVNKMLAQCGELQDRVALLDVYGSDLIGDKGITLSENINAFHDDVGDNFLSYGMAYFPFLHTTVVSPNEVDYTNIDLTGSDSDGAGELQKVLIMEAKNLYPPNDDGSSNPSYAAVEAVVMQISPENESDEVVTLNQNLTIALPLLTEMENTIAKKNGVLPPSGAMAGVYTRVDSTHGVWIAPANVSLIAVTCATYKLNDKQQDDLNQPENGKSIDALREFIGRGTVVWGARTLDGFSTDWRYIQVRRTVIYIEQSIKFALNGFVFSANDGKAWVTVVSMVSNFLQSLWSQGGLMGATASEAFSVECGLGSTMTAEDVLDGYMIVQVKLQMIRPAEVIELTFKQKMEG